MKSLKLLKIAKRICAGSPEEEAYYTISDVVDLWENNHKESALTVLAYSCNLKKVMENYNGIKAICYNDAWIEKNILPKVAEYIISSLKRRKKEFVNALQRWNKEYGKCFINDFMK